MSIAMLDITPAEADFVRKLSNTHEGSFFAILDACDEPRVPAKAFELGDKAISLYRGKAEWSQVTIAPYLVSVNEDEFQWITDNLTGSFWGYFLYCSTDISLATIRTHLRRFLTVKGPQGEELYFRFYDPRVVLKFLETSNEEELNQFFGPIETIFIERSSGFLSVQRSSSVRH